LRSLGRALREADVAYCHFKSNAFLAESHSGENDLDLLIARADAERFAAVLHGLGFKLAVRAVNELPGVLDYYGYDAEADRIVHVHAHYQLIVGDDLTKNYRLPLETAFLESSQPAGELRVPAPELELILLVLRLVLKHCTWDARVALKGPIPGNARTELAYLEERADPERVAALLARWLLTVDAETFHACRAALDTGAGIVAGRRLVRALAPYARRSRAADVTLKLERRFVELVRHFANRPPAKKRLVAGGGVIALVGADGAGKTTAIETLDAWLGKTFAVTRVHLGRPPQSAVRRGITGLALGRGALRRLARRPRRERSTQEAVLATALARDRFLTFRAARRLATNGGLVVCDRFPLPQLQTMDAPRVRRLSDPRRFPGLVERLDAIERRYYSAIANPDVLIVLRVDPEVAVARKPEEDAAFVRARWEEIWSVDWDAVGAHVIDAGAPRDAVMAALKAHVWQSI
jgi:thymidylate kinase